MFSKDDDVISVGLTLVLYLTLYRFRDKSVMRLLDLIKVPIYIYDTFLVSNKLILFIF